MMKAEERILILDGHTNQALACVRSLGKAGYTIFVASRKRFPLAAWSRYCEDRFQLRDESVEAFASLREWAKRAGVAIVLPLTERSCVLCNVKRNDWEAAGITIGCGPEDMLLAAFDKAQTVNRARAWDVRIPLTRSPSSLEECLAAVDQVEFPCVVKPRWSSAWNGTSFLANRGPAYVNSPQDLISALMERKQGNDWPLIQEFIVGQGKGVFALCERGRVVAWFAHERLREARPTGSGSSLRRSIPPDARLRIPAERILSELKWHGPAMIEFKDDGVSPPCLMEINGRFWGSLQLAIDAGVDFPLMWVSILNGQPVEPVTAYQNGLTLRWLLGDVKRFLWILSGSPRGYTDRYPTIRQGIIELFGPQPSGTRLESWRITDPWPAVGEWVGGVSEFVNWLRDREWKIKRPRRPAERSPAPVSKANEKWNFGETV